MNKEKIDFVELVRNNPSQYVGMTNSGDSPECGIYRMICNIVDNSVDEFKLGYGTTLILDITDGKHVSVRDFGRGIPLAAVKRAFSEQCVGMVDEKDFRPGKINVSGAIVVNYLSSEFKACSFREGRCSWALFHGGIYCNSGIDNSPEQTGTIVEFTPDESVFTGFKFKEEIILGIMNKVAAANPGLEIIFNGVPVKA